MNCCIIHTMTYISNKQVKRRYEVINTYRAGLVLLGTEVKSIRNGKGSLVGATVLIRGGEAFLINAHIPPHQEKNAPETYDPTRPRRLLLSKSELHTLYTASEERGLTLIPVAIYNCHRKLKLDIATARKHNFRDRREELKKRDSERDQHRFMKQH